MNLKKIIPYQIKCIVPALGMIGMAMLHAGCQKNEPTDDIELVFDSYYSNISVDIIRNYADRPDVRFVYLTPEKFGYPFQGADCVDIENIRNRMSEYIDVNPKKVRGAGNFQFSPGAPTKAYQDSLWFVQNGWTINRFKHRNVK